MTRVQVRKMVISFLIMVTISAVFLSTGLFLTVDKETIRGQEKYSKEFSGVLKAARYELLQHDLISSVNGINNIYLAYDENDEVAGYIADISVFTDSGVEVRSYLGINSDGSTVTGYRRSGGSSIIDNRLFEQVRGKQMPIALSGNDDDTSLVMSEYDPPAGLKDGTFFAQTVKSDKNGYYDYVEIEIAGGRIKRVKWDGINIDPTTGSRNKASLTGAYVISGENWATQSYKVSHALIELQDVVRLAMKSDGKTEIIEGVTTNIDAFAKLASECLENSKKGFDKEKYIGVISSIADGTPGASKLSDGEDAFVFAFEDQNPFKRKIDGVADYDYMTVYDTTLIREQDQDTGDEENGGEDVSETAPLETSGDEEVPSDVTPAATLSNDTANPEDGIASDPEDSIVTDSVDGIPMSEVRTLISGIADEEALTKAFVSTVNTAYKFFKEYMNWMV